MQKKQLRKPSFIKVEDLQRGRSGYNVYVKVVSATPREIETKDGNKIPMIDCVVADETASAKAFFKGDNTKDIKVGNVIAIRNGVKKVIKGHISLEVDAFGRVTLEKQPIKQCNSEKNISDEEIKFEKRNNQGKNFNRNRSQGRRFNNKTRRNDQFRSEKPRNKEQKGEREKKFANKKPPKNDGDYDRNNNKSQRAQDRKQPNRKYQESRGARVPFTKINEIDPGAERLRIIAKVMSATLVKAKNGNENFRCVIGDQTGVVNAFFSQSDHLVVGKSIALFEAEAKVVKEHIQIQKGRIEEANKKIDRVNEKFNLSAKAWIPID